MALRSIVSKSYLLRLAIVGVVCLGFSGWSYYDGKYAYPQQMAAGRKFQEMEELGIASVEEWRAVAKENGWPESKPKEDYPNEADIAIQFYMVWIAGIPGALVLLNVLRRLGSWIELEGNTLRNSRGDEFTLDQIVKIDKKKWDKKGIAHLYYEHEGDERRFLLDDFIYERPTTDEILLKIEQAIGVDKIVNGKPEKPPKQDDAVPAEPA